MIRSFRAVIAILVATAVFGQAPSSPPSYRFSSGRAVLNIPMELVANGLVLVRAKVNGHPGWFILDNASQGFTIDREYARQIALKSGGRIAAHGGGSDTVQAGVVHDVQISLPGLDLTHRNLVVIELKALEPVIGHEVDGIIGSVCSTKLWCLWTTSTVPSRFTCPMSSSFLETGRHFLSESMTTGSHSLKRPLRYPASSPLPAVF